MEWVGVNRRIRCGRWCNMFTAHVTVMCLESHTISIRVGARRVETLNPTCLAERVFRNVSIKSVRGQIIRSLGEKETDKNLSVNLRKRFSLLIKLCCLPARA